MFGRLWIHQSRAAVPSSHPHWRHNGRFWHLAQLSLDEDGHRARLGRQWPRAGGDGGRKNYIMGRVAHW